MRGGYLGTALATGAVGLAGAVWQVAILRSVAWISRGIRSPARDALLYSLVPTTAFGRASGLERAGDNLGAVGGPLLAALFVAVLGIRPALLIATIPGLFAAVAITIAAREAQPGRSEPTGAARCSRYNLRRTPQTPGSTRVLAAPTLFELGNIAASLLILRATVLLHHNGRSIATAATSIAVLLYAAHNLAATGTALLAGRMIDRSGPRPRSPPPGHLPRRLRAVRRRTALLAVAPARLRACRRRHRVRRACRVGGNRLRPAPGSAAAERFRPARRRTGHRRADLVSRRRAAVGDNVSAHAGFRLRGGLDARRAAYFPAPAAPPGRRNSTLSDDG